MSEHENERRIVNWLGTIALTAIAGAVALAWSASRQVGIDTATIVALIGIAAAAQSSLGTRRTRGEPPAPPDPGTPPPWTPGGTP